MNAGTRYGLGIVLGVFAVAVRVWLTPILAIQSQGPEEHDSVQGAPPHSFAPSKTEDHGRGALINFVNTGSAVLRESYHCRTCCTGGVRVGGVPAPFCRSHNLLPLAYAGMKTTVCRKLYE